jgi:BCD family chlorophyll transporter-like MFS transporter
MSPTTHRATSPVAGPLGWLGVVRLGLVQACLGAIVVLTTSTLNRVMVVELGLAALLPGLLVGLHYAAQATRPRMGWGSDRGQRRTPWIVGGMAVLATGGLTASVAVAWMAQSQAAGLALAALGFLMIGLGVSACGTSLLVLLAKRVTPERRGAAATCVWVMMIAGFAITAGVAGGLLDPYTPARLVAVTAGVAALALTITLLAVRGLEPAASRGVVAADAAAAPALPPVRFIDALREVWAEDSARRFTIFVFVSMLAYSAQDLILEPFAGTVFGLTPGESTRLAGVQHGGVLAGMLLVAAAGTLARRAGLPGLASLRGWTLGGCLASALALAGLAWAGWQGLTAWPLRETVFLLGVANGAFSIGAIGSMMQLASQGRESREGLRMGLWGAAQGMAFGLGGLAGTAASDLAHWLIASAGSAYASVFAMEALLFVVSAMLAMPAIRCVSDPGRPTPAAALSAR